MYGYGYKINSGLVLGAGGGGAPFANTYSLSLDGVDDYLTSGDLSSLVDNKSKLSISLWINLPNAGEQNRITGKYGGSLTKWLGINTSSDKLNFVVSNIGSSLAYSQTGAVLSDNTWHHVVCVFDGTQSTANDRIKIYVDNVDEALTVNGTLPTSTYDFTLEGSNPTWYLGQNGFSVGANELRGNLDEYAIYSNVALSSSEVNEIYNSGTPNNLSTLSVTPDLWYRMGDGDTAPTINDNVGSNSATMVNMDSSDIVENTP